MGTAYFNREDVKKRLNSTICFFDKKPYYVTTDYTKDNMVNITPLATVVTTGEGKMEVDYTSNKFDYKSPPLGYMFNKRLKEAIYVSRSPDRQQSQGLSPYCLHTQPQIERYDPFYVTQDFEDMLMGRYPGHATAESMLSAGLATSVPISRNVALALTRRGLMELFYKGRPIACNLKNRGFELYDYTERNYLSKLLINDGIILGA